MLILAGSIISFLSIGYNNGCLIAFLFVSPRRSSLLFRGLLICIVVFVWPMFLVVVLTGCFCICFWWNLIISISGSNYRCVCACVCVCVCVIVEFRCIDTLFPLLCTFVSNAPALTLLGLRRRECAFRFEETQSNILIMFCGANQSINRNIFKPLSNIVACGNCDYSLLCTIFKFTGMLWSWNIFSKYSLIKTICQRCRQLDHMTGSVSCIISFYKINYVQTSTS